MKKDELTEDLIRKDPIKFLTTTLENIGVIDNIFSKESLISFDFKGWPYMLSILEQERGVKLMNIPWIELDAKGPSLATFMRIVEDSKVHNYGNSEICYFKSYDGDKAFAFNMSIIEEPIAELNEQKLGNAILGMAIQKEWILSHFLLECETIQN